MVQAAGARPIPTDPRPAERPRPMGEQPVGVRLVPQDDQFQPKDVGRRYQPVGEQPVGVRIRQPAV